MENRTITSLVSEARAVANDVEKSFAGLSPQQLNWKPQPEQWSAGQCLDHLFTSTGSYFPTFEMILNGKKRATLWERIPILPGVFGKLLIKSLSPQSTRKLQAPKAFRPASSDIDAGIVEDFVAQIGRLIETMTASASLEVDRIIITSPAMSLVTCSLLDAYRIILIHDQRHILQAQRVMQLTDFPAQAKRKVNQFKPTVL